MDYLEVTKNESLRKYEENIYLLGKIFSNKDNYNNKDDKTDKNIEEDSESDSSSESDTNSEGDISIQNEIINLFKHSKSSNNNLKNETEDMEAFFKVKNELEKKLDGASNSEETTNLLEQLNNALLDYNENKSFLKNQTYKFKNDLNQFGDVFSKLRTTKNLELELDDILNQCKKLNVLSQTFNQMDNLTRQKDKKQHDKQLPFSKLVNIVILPL